MTALAGALLAAILTSSAVKGDDDPTERNIGRLMQEPILSGENITHHPPEELLRRAQEQRHLIGVATSLAGEDDFFQAYERKLRPLTDRRFPQAKQVRPKLIEVFNLANDFCSGVLGSGSGFGHYRIRIPGYVEWDLYSGYAETFGQYYGPRYGFDDIRSLGTLVVRANWEERASVLVEGPTDVTSAMKMFLPPLERALTELEGAETKLPSNARYYFRGRLVKELSRYL